MRLLSDQAWSSLALSFPSNVFQSQRLTDRRTVLSKQWLYDGRILEHRKLAPRYRRLLRLHWTRLCRLAHGMRRCEWPLFRGALGLDGIPDLRSHVGAVETLDRADARRRRHVDLGEVAVDHVDADEQQAALAQRRAERGADLTLAG